MWAMQVSKLLLADACCASTLGVHVHLMSVVHRRSSGGCPMDCSQSCNSSARRQVTLLRPSGANQLVQLLVVQPVSAHLQIQEHKPQP